jgi:hypothetical protein
MKPEQAYQELKDLAEKLHITVAEQNLRKTGIHVNSGLCVVKGEKMFIMDKHESLRHKIDILGAVLGEMQTEDIYMVPAIRELIQRGFKKQRK